jgi:hypothetical protein
MTARPSRALFLPGLFPSIPGLAGFAATIGLLAVAPDAWGAGAKGAGRAGAPTAAPPGTPVSQVQLTSASTKAECVAANETGQDLRHSGKLIEARTSLATCLAASCPGPVREDCAQRLAEIEQAVPTVVLVANDAAGKDLTSVRVMLDGQPWLDKLDGKAAFLNPGAHQFHFESDGVPAKDESVVISEGEKNRRIVVVLAPPPVEHPLAAPVPSGGASSARTQRTIGIGVAIGGVVAAAVGGVFGLVAKSTQDHAVSQCAGGNPNDCPVQAVNDSHNAHDQATVSTVAFVAAGALLAGGAVIYFTAPPERGEEKRSVGLVFGDRAIGLRGTW